MQSDRTRNIIVGLTMLIAAALAMYGILLLGKGPGFGGLHPYHITLEANNANGITEGGKVDLNGVVVGEVNSVALVKSDSGNLVARVKLEIDGSTDIPASATASIGKQAALGASYISIYVNKIEGPLLPHDGSAVIHAADSDGGLIPQSVFNDIHDFKGNLTTLSDKISVVADDLHKMLAYNSPEAIAAANPNDPNRPVENVSTLVIRLNGTIKSLQTLLTDPALQGQVRQIIGNIADVSEHLKGTLAKADTTIASFGAAATQASATVEVTQKQILRVSEKLVDTLGQIEATTRQLSQGNGTTGKLINDPRLYEGLVDLSKSLRGTVDDLDFLLKKWKDEGVNLKLK